MNLVKVGENTFIDLDKAVRIQVYEKEASKDVECTFCMLDGKTYVAWLKGPLIRQWLKSKCVFDLTEIKGIKDGQ